MDLLISQGFWVDRQEIGGEEGGPGVAGIPVSREGSWLLDPFQPKGSSETIRGGPAYAVPDSRSLCPSCSEGTDVRVPYWLSPEHLEKGGSVPKNKTARIISSPS